VAFHDFAPYFAERLRLKAEKSTCVDVPEMNPTPADLQRCERRSWSANQFAGPCSLNPKEGTAPSTRWQGILELRSAC